MAAVRVRVAGRVQGVGFRAYVANTAHLLGLSGEVWNCSDRGVTAVLQAHDRATLEDAVEQIRRGPGRVDSVVVEELAEPTEYDGFAVTATRPC